MKKWMMTGVFLFAILAAGCAKDPIVEKEDKGVVLTVLAGQSTSDAGIEDMINDWMSERFPEVELEWECVDWGEGFDTQIRGRFAAGDTPDIMIGKAQDVQTYAGTGNLGVIPKKCSNLIKESALKSVTVSEKVYGMPYNAWYQGVIYNKDIFSSLGLEPPSTQEELDQIIDILEVNEIVPFAAHFQESWKIGNTTMQFMMNDIFRNTPDWGDKFRAGKVDFQGNEIIEQCMLNNKKILDHSWDDALVINQFESDSRFTQGKAAMYLTGSWSMQFTNQYGTKINFGIFPYPNAAGDADLIKETNLTFMKSSHSSHGELIDDIFYALLSDEKLTQEILDFTQSSSVVKKEIESVYQSRIQQDIDQYEEEERVVDVATGNAQLMWSFQNSVANVQLSWLKNEITLKEVLLYADENRMNSAYRK